MTVADTRKQAADFLVAGYSTLIGHRCVTHFDGCTSIAGYRRAIVWRLRDLSNA